MSVLVLAPHADDEVLGMGGTIARFREEGRPVTVAVLTGHGTAPHPIWPPENWTRIRAECRDAMAVLGVEDLRFFELPASCLDSTPTHEVNGAIAGLIRDVAPEEVYVPFAHDLHRDHGEVSYAAVVALRAYLPSARGLKRLACYETLSETHLAPPGQVPGFAPNFHVDITGHLPAKLRAMECYASQVQEAGLPRSLATIEALACLRGAHMGCEAAESFQIMGQYAR